MIQSEKQPLVLMTWGVLLLVLTIIALGYGGDGDDAYWHIKVGEWILTHQQVPTSGIFSYTNTDKPWISHEWLSAVLLYKVFQYSGWAGLVFLAIISVFVTLLVLLNFLLERLSTVQSLIFVLFAYLLMAIHILPRPHILAIPIIAYWTASLIKASEKQAAPPFYLLPLMILWVNMHGSFVVGIAFSIFFSIEAIFYAAAATRKQLLANWTIFIAATISCAAMTPHGINGLLLPFQLSNQTYALERVLEWQSVNFHHFQALELWLLSFLSLILLQGIKLPVFRLVFLLSLLHLSLKHLRHAADLLSTLSPLILATPLATHWHSKPEISFKDLWPKTYQGLALLIIYFLGLFFYLSDIKETEYQQAQQIQKVLLALKPEQQQLGNVLNNYGSGDFLIYLDYPTFIDTRAELYGDPFMKYYFEAIELVDSSKKLEAMIAKYHVTWTLFYTHEAINTYLATQPSWHKLYSDKVFTIYINQSVKLSAQTLAKLKILEKLALLEQKAKDKKINSIASN